MCMKVLCSRAVPRSLAPAVLKLICFCLVQTSRVVHQSTAPQTSYQRTNSVPAHRYQHIAQHGCDRVTQHRLSSLHASKPSARRLPWPHGLSPCRASSEQSCAGCLVGRNGAAGLGGQIKAGSAAAAAAPASTPAMPRQQQQQPAQRPHSQLTTDLRKTTAQHSATVAACAAIAGCISRTATAPFDRVRIVSAGTGITLGHAIRRIRSEGASSLCAAHACISVCPHHGARHVCCSCFLLLPVHVCCLVPCQAVPPCMQLDCRCCA